MNEENDLNYHFIDPKRILIIHRNGYMKDFTETEQIPLKGQ